MTQIGADPDFRLPRETMWQGKYVRAIKQGRWEYVSRTHEIRAVVILAEHDGGVLLVEQFRMPTGTICLELPAGLVGDEEGHCDVEETALKELEEETGYSAERIETVGDYYSSPGLLAEGFTLVRAHGLKKVGPGGGVGGEDIVAHLVPRAELRAFIERKRAEGVGIDAKLMMFLDF